MVVFFYPVADPGGGGGDRDDHPAPFELVPILKTYCKVFDFFGGRMTSSGQCPRGGGGCL